LRLCRRTVRKGCAFPREFFNFYWGGYASTEANPRRSLFTDIFGSKHATTNYGILYTAKGVGSIPAGAGAALLMAATDSWIPVFWGAVACHVIAAGLALLWLKPRVARLVREQAGEP
jgi:hypothetical protein